MGLFGSSRFAPPRFLSRWGRRSVQPPAAPSSDVLGRFSQRMIALNGDRLGADLAATLIDVFQITAAAVYLQNGDGSLRLTDARGAIPADPVLAAADWLRDEKAMFAWNRVGATEPVVAESESGWSAAIPLRVDGAGVGLIALGPKQSGAAFEPDECALLTLVGAHAAVALKKGEWTREIKRQREEIELLQRRLEAETALVHAEIRYAPSFPYIVGTSPALHEALVLVEKIAPTEATVLITGETGTGKELIARAVHDLSARRSAPLISVNCPAIPLELAESELFGHERGAFTGAVDARAGKLELADGGTIFLDEVADLPMPVQVKLLRVLQEREVHRVGSHKVRRLDLRVIAATNRDLREAVQAGSFREDLYYRLAAMPIHLPPLRDRAGDIRMLASHFLDLAAARYQKLVRGFTVEALVALEQAEWPGNVRELAHIVERAVLLCAGDRVQLSELPGISPPDPTTANLGATLRAEKRRRVEAALFQCSGNQAAAARLLGMSRSNFARLVKTLGVRLPKLRLA